MGQNLGAHHCYCRRQPQLTCQGPCRTEVIWKDDGPTESLDDDPNGEGDVKNSQAMINHCLLKAARDGDLKGIKAAIQRGAYVETRRPFVMTPESALVNSANTSPNRGTGLTPLMYASQGGYAEAAVLLIEAGACVHAEDEDGFRALHFAATSGSYDTCWELLTRSPDADAPDDEGRNALDHVPETCQRSKAERDHWMHLFTAERPQRRRDAAPEPPGVAGVS